MRVVVVTKIFPSSLEPLSAPFNRQQIGELARLCDVEVLEAIPHVPFARVTSFPARAARLAALPARERLHGIDVSYVRQLYLPRVGLPLAVPLYLASLLPHRRCLERADVILASWAYPDGCAAVLASRALRKPCVVKVHGTDVNVVLRRRSARLVARHSLPLADALVAVSRPLQSEILRLGVPSERTHVIANGVDPAIFHPRDRAQARRAVGLAADARAILFVGRLEPQKGVLDLLDAFEQVRAKLSQATLVLLGDGVAAVQVRGRAARWPETAARVLGPRPHSEVAAWLGACDVLALPSWAEGTPNVVLEALASGRPVVATRVGGIPDAVPSDRGGFLVAPRDVRALAEALEQALTRDWDPESLVALGPQSWRDSAERLRRVLEDVCAPRPHEPFLSGASQARHLARPARPRPRCRLDPVRHVGETVSKRGKR